MALVSLPPAVPGAGAQEVSGWLQPSVVHAPPPGSPGFSAANLFGTIGGGLRLEGRGRGAGELSAGGGQGFEDGSGSWVHGLGAAELATRTGALNLILRGEAFGLGYLRPHHYRVSGAAVRPRLTSAVGRALLILDAYAARGRWRQEAAVDSPPFPPIPGGQTGNTESGSLQLYGARVEVGRMIGGGWLRLSGEVFDSRQGAEPGRAAGSLAELILPVGTVSVTAGAGVWRRPTRTEATGHIIVSRPVGARTTVYATASRAPVDPLYGTESGPVHGIGLDVRLRASRGGALAAVGEASGSGRQVTFRLSGVEADRVAVAGDFSAWEPLPMEWTGAEWVLDTVLEPGAHNFSFVLDGEHWYVPADAPGQVSDGWGRRNAIIVVEEP